MIQFKNLTITTLLTLLLLSLLGCADNPTEPTLTEEEIARVVAEELVKIDFESMATEAIKDANQRAQEIAKIALKSTVYIFVRTAKDTVYGSGVFIGTNQAVPIFTSFKIS